MSRSTILIAPATAIPALRQHKHLYDSQAFADTDANLALDAIRRTVPAVIAVERMFAVSLLGQVFLDRVRSDPKLAGCEIQRVGIRESPRHPVNTPIFIDGAPGMLIDISRTGAQLVCQAPLQTSHRLYLSLRGATVPLAAFVVRVEPEQPPEGVRYRIGVEFAASAAAAVADYVTDLPK